LNWINGKCFKFTTFAVKARKRSQKLHLFEWNQVNEHVPLNFLDIFTAIPSFLLHGLDQVHFERLHTVRHRCRPVLRSSVAKFNNLMFSFFRKLGNVNFNLTYDAAGNVFITLNVQQTFRKNFFAFSVYSEKRYNKF
jgi:hypothetical protein